MNSYWVPTVYNMYNSLQNIYLQHAFLRHVRSSKGFHVKRLIQANKNYYLANFQPRTHQSKQLRKSHSALNVSGIALCN